MTRTNRRRLIRQHNCSHRAALIFALLACALIFSSAAFGQKPRRSTKKIPTEVFSSSPIAEAVMLRIIRAEDERRWDEDLASLLSDPYPPVRIRAALAAGRIGDERAVPALISVLEHDTDETARAMAAFGLGEIESAVAADALTRALPLGTGSAEVRARAVEALGKIAAALPKSEEARKRAIGETILNVLKEEAARKPVAGELILPGRHRKVVLLALTAALRAQPTTPAPAIVPFLSDADARIRADALNTMARLRVKAAGEQIRKLLIEDPDPVVRANSARALGAAEDKSALDALVNRMMNDTDLRVRVSSIRALGNLKDVRAAQPLFDRAVKLQIQSLTQNRLTAANLKKGIPPSGQNEWLEIFTALGNIIANSGANFNLKTSLDPPPAAVVTWNTKHIDPELEISLARNGPHDYLVNLGDLQQSHGKLSLEFFGNWRKSSSIAQGLGVIATLSAEKYGADLKKDQAEAQRILRAMIDDARLSAIALPDVLTAYAVFKPNDLSETLRRELKAQDFIVRATAAGLMAELPPDEANARALAEALPAAMRDEMNDAALAILDALAKQKTGAANEAIKSALDSEDHLIRRKAVALLKENGVGDFSSRIGTVKSRNTIADYRRALARRGKQVRAVVTTDKGAFTIELLPEDAPLTVDNFIMLARRRYFDNVTVHRVVPNFVIQDGDPRGDGNGGPGYQIRCEINEVEYERGAVGMALSGKDTGGSQWFVTHSPQPHLDGGYTVFGRVVAGLDVVDKIARGDRILSIRVAERASGSSKKH